MKGPLTGRHVLIAVLAFFGVVFAVNGVMTYIALDSFSGLATEDAYRKGLRYNEQLATADAQAAQGWRVKVDYREGSGSLRLTLRDKDDLPLRSLQIEGIVGRPASAQHDRQPVLAHVGCRCRRLVATGCVLCGLGRLCDGPQLNMRLFFGMWDRYLVHKATSQLSRYPRTFKLTDSAWQVVQSCLVRPWLARRWPQRPLRRMWRRLPAAQSLP